MLLSHDAGGGGEQRQAASRLRQQQWQQQQPANRTELAAAQPVVVRLGPLSAQVWG